MKFIIRRPKNIQCDIWSRFVITATAYITLKKIKKRVETRMRQQNSIPRRSTTG